MNGLNPQACTAQTEQFEMACTRSNMYGFLARVYREEVTPELLRAIRGSPVFRCALEEAGVDLGNGFLQRDETPLLEDLAVEYTRLFIGPGPHISPHESVQEKESGGMLTGAATAKVKRFIEAVGFDYRADYHGLPDHISVELEFMQASTAYEAQAWEYGNEELASRCLEMQAEFMRLHLSRWVPRFCNKIQLETEETFYSEMAALTRDFLESESMRTGEREMA